VLRPISGGFDDEPIFTEAALSRLESQRGVPGAVPLEPVAIDPHPVTEAATSA